MKRTLVIFILMIGNLSLAGTRLISVDRIIAFDNQKLQISADTSYRSFPSGALVTTSISATLENRVVDRQGYLSSGRVVFHILSHWNDGDHIFDSVALTHCMELDVQKSLAKLFARESISGYSVMGLTFGPPEVTAENPSPVACSKFDQIELD